MGGLNFVIWIVAIVMAAQVIEQWIKHRSKRSDEDAALNADAENRIADLEERIQVLERIVTENKFDLKRQINDL